MVCFKIQSLLLQHLYIMFFRIKRTSVLFGSLIFIQHSFGVFSTTPQWSVSYSICPIEIFLITASSCGLVTFLIDFFGFALLILGSSILGYLVGSDIFEVSQPVYCFGFYNSLTQKHRFPLFLSFYCRL